MTDLPKLVLTETNLDQINDATGRIVVFVPESGKLDQFGRRLNRLMKGALERLSLIHI